VVVVMMMMMMMMKMMKKPRRSSHWFLFTYPSHTLRSLSLHSAHLPVTVHFLPVTVSWSLYYTCFLPVWEIQHVGTHCQKCLILMFCKNPGHLASRIKIYGIPGVLWSDQDESDPPSFRTPCCVLAT
jgi:hypothetical protein